jgi:hypothetical protein
LILNHPSRFELRIALKRVTPDGNLFTAEFLIDDPVSLPHHNAFIKNLGILGIEASVRIVDAVQYRRRLAPIIRESWRLAM